MKQESLQKKETHRHKAQPENPFKLTKEYGKVPEPALDKLYKHAKPEEKVEPESFSLSVKRPLMSWAVWVAACIVMSVIALAPSLADQFGIHSFGQAQRNMPFVEAATTLLLYCIPAIIAITFVILKNIYIPRTARVALAVISGVLIMIVFWLLVSICFMPLRYQAYHYLLQITQAINYQGWWAIAILGILFGLSLPVSQKAREHILGHPNAKKTRHTVLIIAICWFILLGILEFVVLVPYFI